MEFDRRETCGASWIGDLGKGSFQIKSSKPGAVLKKVASAGTMVVTRDGRPMAILMPTSPESLMEDVQEIAFSKARRAVRNLRAVAFEVGVDSLSVEEIEKEIQAVRKSAQ